MTASPSKLEQIAARAGDKRRAVVFLWPLLIVEIVTGVLLGLQATNQPQEYDPRVYAGEALSVLGGDGSWLAASPHNYLYPAFLALLHNLGLWVSFNPAPVDGRFGVGVVQIGLLYAAALFLVVVLSRCLRVRFVSAGVVVCAIAIIPAAAWSGYWLSESLAVPLLLAIIALWVWTCHRLFLRPGSVSTLAIIFALGLASGSAWMARPALIWVPVGIALMTGLLIVASTLLLRVRNRDLGLPLPSYPWATALFAILLIGAALSLVPQLALDGNISHALKLDLAGQQAQGSLSVWRYATNLTGFLANRPVCGPVSVVFTPLTSDIEPIRNGLVHAPGSPIWTISTMVAHLVSGWDPLPSPTYMSSWTAFPWILVTLVSGFVVAGPLLACSGLVTEARSMWAGWRLRKESAVDLSRFAFVASLLGLLALFAVTEIALLRTATEFRFNVMAWLIGGACLVFLIASGWMSRNRLVAYVGISLALSAVIFLIGQMTLDYSKYWLQCR
jgi:hypothetical protein